jgi:hypothetical protein
MEVIVYVSERPEERSEFLIASHVKEEKRNPQKTAHSMCRNNPDMPPRDFRQRLPMIDQRQPNAMHVGNREIGQRKVEPMTSASVSVEEL